MKTTRYLLIRRFKSKQTEGEFQVLSNDSKLEKLTWSWKTLELPWKDNEPNESCIPDGFYIVKRHNSPTFGECFHVTNVPGRSHILFHAGNYAGSVNPKTGTPDTKGCILPGKALTDINADGISDVTSSGLAMKEMLRVLPDEFELEIFTKA